eukprot:scaffold212_cov404-Prasinococcus_capsulatus_cf.AAC.22
MTAVAKVKAITEPFVSGCRYRPRTTFARVPAFARSDCAGPGPQRALSTLSTLCQRRLPSACSWISDASGLNRNERTRRACSRWFVCAASGEGSDNGHSQRAHEWDAVVVLAGGLKPDGTLPPWVKAPAPSSYSLRAVTFLRALQARIEAAFQFWKSGATPVVLLTGGGTPHKPPPLTRAGYPILESTAMADYLLELGMPASAILKVRAVGRAGHATSSTQRVIMVNRNGHHMTR